MYIDDNLITQAKVIELGWTVSMIKKLLPEPKLAQNTVYKCAAPIKLWNKDVVLEVMKTEEYKELWGKACKRSEAAKKIAEKKAMELNAQFQVLANGLEVRVIDNDKLVNRALEAKDIFEHEHDRDFDRSRITQKTLERFVVNYIRHNLVAYDKSLELLYRQVGKQRAYAVFKKIVLEKIAVAYPLYANECMRQLSYLGD